MSIGIYFPIPSMSPAQYDEVLVQLEAAGASAPDGRTYHCAFAAGEGLHVFDVWDSEEAFGAFGETLMPILAGVGVDPGEPMISAVHNIITG